MGTACRDKASISWTPATSASAAHSLSPSNGTKPVASIWPSVPCPTSELMRTPVGVISSVVSRSTSTFSTAQTLSGQPRVEPPVGQLSRQRSSDVRGPFERKRWHVDIGIRQERRRLCQVRQPEGVLDGKIGREAQRSVQRETRVVHPKLGGHKVHAAPGERDCRPSGERQSRADPGLNDTWPEPVSVSAFQFSISRRRSMSAFDANGGREPVKCRAEVREVDPAGTHVEPACTLTRNHDAIRGSLSV